MTCPHNMPNPKTCLDCMEEGGVPVAKWEALGALVLKYRSVCRACGEDIPAGQTVKRWDKEDQDTAYTHLGCGLN